MQDYDIKLAEDGTLRGRTLSDDANWKEDFLQITRNRFKMNTIPVQSTCLVVGVNGDDTKLWTYDRTKLDWFSM